jgi:hypothetical protein
MDQAALTELKEILGLAELPEDDLRPYWIAELASAGPDLDKLQAVADGITSALADVYVNLLQANPFRLRAHERDRARRSYDAVMRAASYVDLALAEVPRAADRGSEFADVIKETWDASQSAESAGSRTEPESETGGIAHDLPAARARLAKLARERRELEHEKSAATSERRVSDIDYALQRISMAEAGAKLEIVTAQAISRRQDITQQGEAIVAASHNIMNWTWKETGRALRDKQHQHHLQQAWRRRFRAARLFGYALLVVAVGVVTDVGLGHTGFASVWASFVAAVILWAMDSGLISPRLARWDLRRNLQELTEEIKVCSATLVSFRVTQVGMSAMASYEGLPAVQLLSAELMDRRP